MRQDAGWLHVRGAFVARPMLQRSDGRSADLP